MLSLSRTDNAASPRYDDTIDGRASAASPALAGTRDQRVDFYRGVALAMIFVNHIPGNVWEGYTSRNFGFSDAAEVFVFLAGFSSAFAYGRTFLAGSKLVATVKAWRRAGLLYLVHMTLTMLAVGLFSWAALAFGRGELLMHLGLETLSARPLETIIGLATMGHQIGYVNILPMYCVLLLMIPALLALASFGRGVLLSASLALWMAANAFNLDIPNYPYPGGWFFNPFAWQLIFSFGLTCGLSKWQTGSTVAYDARLYGLALGYLGIAFLFVESDLWGWHDSLNLPVMLAGFDKTFVSVPRLLHLLCMLYVFTHMPKTSPLSSFAADNPLVRLGRHSLPVFATGTVLSLICQVVRFGRPPSLGLDTMLVVSGLCLQFALAYALDGWRALLAQKTQRGIKP